MTKKLFRTIGVYKAQFLSMIAMIAIGTGIFLGFNMEWATIEQNVDSFLADTHLADYRIVWEEGFSQEEQESIAGLDGVDAAVRFAAFRAEVQEQDGDTMQVCVGERPGVSDFAVMEGEAYSEESVDGIWLSDQYAHVNGLKLGDYLTFSYNNMEIKGQILGLIKAGEHTVCLSDPSQILPDFKTHGFAYISPVMYETALGMAYYPQINVRSQLHKEDFTRAVDGALSKTVMILSKEENVSYAGPHGEIDEGKTMGTVLPALFLLIAVLTMVTTMHRIASKEKLQIGTFKALGFKDRRILRHYTSYSLFVAVVGSALGVGLGLVIVNMIMDPNGDMMSKYIDMPRWDLAVPGFCYWVMALMIVGLTMIGYLSARQMLRGTAADALRPYTPKRVKPLFIERFAFFHRLSFGIRWNLRDTVRHKARTLMSLLGTMGCVVIMLGCFGMSDSVNMLYEKYYEGAMCYVSRIFVTDGDTLADDYDGDASASIHVQLGQDAVSMDIYRLGRDQIRFLDENMNYTSITDEGVYVCRRIAQEHNLSVGDSFTVSPFGTEEVYTLEVAGILSSYVKSITMTEEYAQKSGIPYAIDSVYTQWEKKDIPIGGQIRSVQTHQSLVEAFYVMLDTMKAMLVILVTAAVILGIVVLYNLGIMSYTERWREFATLKVVGFKDRKIGRLLIGQNLAITAVGILLGVPAARSVLQILIDELAPEYEMTMYISPVSYGIAVAMTVGVSYLVSLMLSRKNHKINMVEALKSED